VGKVEYPELLLAEAGRKMADLASNIETLHLML
jgi:hypothetical protein